MKPNNYCGHTIASAALTTSYSQGIANVSQCNYEILIYVLQSCS